MKLGIDYTPQGLIARYCISCTHPCGEQGSWLFIGDSHKTGEQISPFFQDFMAFHHWLTANGWEKIHAEHPLTVRKLYSP